MCGFIVEQLFRDLYPVTVVAYEDGDVAGRVTALLQLFDRCDHRRFVGLFLLEFACELRDADITVLRRFGALLPVLLVCVCKHVGQFGTYPRR